MREIKIYGIVDSSTNQIKYIGQSHQPERRFRAHLRDTHTLIGKWIDGQIKQGKKPKYTILSSTTIDDALELEKQFIIANKETVLNLIQLDDSDKKDRITSEVIKSLVDRGYKVEYKGYWKITAP